MGKKLKWVSGIATTTVLATAASGIWLSNQLLYVKIKDPEFVLKREREAQRYDSNWFKQCPKQSLNIPTANGYTINGYFLKPLNTTNTVIICHGVTENKMNSVKYARLFEKLGFNAIVYDHRRHGGSGGTNTSYGHYEKVDLQAVVKFARDLIGEDALLGIHGESMGAATTLLYAATVEDAADFYVSDCAFSNFAELVNLIIKGYLRFELIPALHLTDLFTRLRGGYNFKNISPLSFVQQIEKPVLFIHSKPDDFIPSYMTEQLYEAKTTGYKELVLFEEGAHAQSYNDNPLLYEQKIMHFLQASLAKYSPPSPEESAS